MDRMQICALQSLRAAIRKQRAPLEAMLILIGALEAMVAPGIALSQAEVREVSRVAGQIAALAQEQDILPLADAATRLSQLTDGMKALAYAPTLEIALQLPVLRRLAVKY